MKRFERRNQALVAFPGESEDVRRMRRECVEMAQWLKRKNFQMAMVVVESGRKQDEGDFNPQ